MSAAKSYTNMSDVLRGMERVYALRGSYNIAAVNMSLGTEDTYSSSCDRSIPAIKAMIDQLKAAGIATVISSGNDGVSNGLSMPACISSAVSVGSVSDRNWGTCYTDAGTPAPTDQVIGLGDGATARFELVKLYGDDDDAQRRRITRPRGGTVRVSVNGVETGNFVVEPLGVIALVIAPGVGAVGIVRISGPDALVVGAQIAGRTLPPRRALHVIFHDQGEPIDDGIVLAFPAKRLRRYAIRTWRIFWPNAGKWKRPKSCWRRPKRSARCRVRPPCVRPSPASAASPMWLWPSTGNWPSSRARRQPWLRARP